MKILALGLFLIGAISCTLTKNNKERQPSEALSGSSSESPKLIQFHSACKELPRDCFKLNYTHGSRLTIMGFLSNATVAGTGGFLEKTYHNKFLPMGFGIPFSFYDEFMKINFSNYNDSEKSLTSSSDLNESALKDIQAKILYGEIPDSFYKKTVYELEFLKKLIKFEYGNSDIDELIVKASYQSGEGQELKSSDSPNSLTFKISETSFFDSKKTCQLTTSKDSVSGIRTYSVEPKSLACAIKGVYALHWSTESLSKRSDYKSNAIALTVETPDNFRKDIKLKANSLLSTKIFADQQSFGHQIYTQQGSVKASSKNNQITSELFLIKYDDYQRFSSSTPLRFAKPSPTALALNQYLLNEQEIRKMSFIANHIEQKYCEIYSELYPNNKCNLLLHDTLKQNALGIRFKVFDNNTIIIDDMSPYTEL